MYDRILVPVDLSDRNDTALRTASEMAREPGAAVTLLHVVETIEGLPAEDQAGFYAGFVAKAERKLAEWAEVFAKQGLPVEVSVVQGKRAREILRCADEQACDLIILSTHRMDSQRLEGALGTISHQVALLARCSVLLVRS